MKLHSIGFALRSFCVVLIAAPAISYASNSLVESAERNSASGKHSSRLEELFIWKISEELKLTPDDEPRFAKIIRSLNTQRRKATDDMEQAVQKLQSAKTKAETEKALALHRKALAAYQESQLDELDRLKKLMGPEKLARYLIVKNQINEQLKTLLSSPAPVETPSSTPQVIEEK